MLEKGINLSIFDMRRLISCQIYESFRFGDLTKKHIETMHILSFAQVEEERCGNNRVCFLIRGR